jgi:hypothetical protein
MLVLNNIMKATRRVPLGLSAAITRFFKSARERVLADFAALRRRILGYRRGSPTRPTSLRVRHARFEFLENRAMLTTLTWVGPAGGTWDANDANNAYWSAPGNPNPVVWQNGSDAVFPAAGTSASHFAVNVANNAGTSVYARSITFQSKDSSGTDSASYYDINATGSGDQLIIDPAGTAVTANRASVTLPNVATINVPVVRNTASNSVNTINIGNGGTGTVMIAARTNMDALNVNVSSGEFQVEGTLNVYSAMDVSGSAVLNGGDVANGGNPSANINLVSGSLTWESSASGQFLGAISGAGGISVNGQPTTTGGTTTYPILTLGANTFTGGTDVSGGTLKFGDNVNTSVPSQSALHMTGVGVVDLNGMPGGSSLSKITGTSGTTITNSSSSPTILTIHPTSPNSVPSVFSGTIENGNGGVELSIIGCTLDLSGGYAKYTGQYNGIFGVSTVLENGSIILNPAQWSSPGFENADIQENGGGSVTFDAPAGNWNFYGQIYGSSLTAEFDIVKKGAGTLTLSPDTNHQYNYNTLKVLGGSLVLGSVFTGNVSPTNAVAFYVDGGGTLNLGGLTGVPFGSSTLADGKIINGSFAIVPLAELDVEYGLITASFSMNQPVYKQTYSGSNFVSIPEVSDTNTVVFEGTSMQVGATHVEDGTLQVDGLLTSSGVTIDANGTLQLGDGTSIDGKVTCNVVNNGALTFDIYEPPATPPTVYVFSYVVSGLGSLTSVGPAIVKLTGNNSYSGGTNVFNGTTIITTVAYFPDGTNLNVGALAAKAFPAPIVGDGSESSSESNRSILTLDDSGSGTGPVVDNNGLTQLQALKVVGQQAFTALMLVRYPTSTSLAALTGTQQIQLADDFSAIVDAAAANNGGTWDSMSESTMNAAIGDFLTSIGKTATANSNTWSPSTDNPWGKDMITLCNFISKFFATHDIS